MISDRYATLVGVMVALAIVPTAIHQVRGVRADDGLKATAAVAVVNGMDSAPTARKAEWVNKYFETSDWIERAYTGPGSAVTLFVARSYDAKRLYHHPELALLRGSDTDLVGVKSVADRPDIPLFVMKTSKPGVTGLGVYALYYDGAFVKNPILFQLTSAGRLVFAPQRPMTLFMASDSSGTVSQLASAPATRVLLAAIANFEAQNRPQSTAGME
jgi:hypothetical protein